MRPHEQSELMIIPLMTPDPDCSIITITFIKYSLSNAVQWFSVVEMMLARAVRFSSQFYLVLIWIPHEMCGPTIRVACVTALCSSLPTSYYGDSMDAEEYIIIVADVIF